MNYIFFPPKRIFSFVNVNEYLSVSKKLLVRPIESEMMKQAVEYMYLRLRVFTVSLISRLHRLNFHTIDGNQGGSRNVLITR